MARANVLALEGEVPSGVYNIRTGIEASVNRLYEPLRAISGKDLPCEYGPAKPGERTCSSVDPTLACCPPLTLRLRAHSRRKTRS